MDFTLQVTSQLVCHGMTILVSWLLLPILNTSYSPFVLVLFIPEVALLGLSSAFPTCRLSACLVWELEFSNSSSCVLSCVAGKHLKATYGENIFWKTWVLKSDRFLSLNFLHKGDNKQNNIAFNLKVISCTTPLTNHTQSRTAFFLLKFLWIVSSLLNTYLNSFTEHHRIIGIRVWWWLVYQYISSPPQFKFH